VAAFALYRAGNIVRGGKDEVVRNVSHGGNAIDRTVGSGHSRTGCTSRPDKRENLTYQDN